MIDRDRLAQMMDGDYAIADKFIQSFRRQVEEQIPLLSAYLASNDYQMLANTAHIIKTLAGYMGLRPIVAIAQSLEDEATRGNPTEVLRIQTTQLQSLLSEVLDAM